MVERQDILITLRSNPGYVHQQAADEIERLRRRNFEAEIAGLRADKAELLAGLEFYADPENYHAIAFFSDPPHGEFMNDFSETDWSDYDRPMPGKRARELILEHQPEHKEETE